MNSGYYAAVSGLRSQTQALEVLANNMANVSTTGFRAQRAIFRSLLAGDEAGSGNALQRAVNDFSVSGGSQTDFAAGNLLKTGNPLDLAIEGRGLFAVQTPAGRLYTRNGSFHSASGQLVDASGNPVLGEQGAVSVPAGQVSISADGTISVQGAIAGQIGIFEFDHESSLTPVGSGYYSAPPGAARAAANSSLEQGMLESSNVNEVSAMVELIAVERHAEMLERAMSVFYSDINKVAASDLPRV
jgi:flagellar basal-body rod protein FlgF/flagellar basal-body rod protein FlgG